MSRIVINQNDFPTFLLPDGATEAEARALCNKLQAEHPTNVRQKQECPWVKSPAVYFHWSVVQDYKL